MIYQESVKLVFRKKILIKFHFHYFAKTRKINVRNQKKQNKKKNQTKLTLAIRVKIRESNQKESKIYNGTFHVR